MKKTEIRVEKLNKNKTIMKTQTIKRKDLSEIYSSVCENWQKKIAELALLQSGDSIEVEESLIKKAYSEANDDQKKLLNKFFKIASDKITDRIKTFDDVLKAAGKTMEEVIPWKNPKDKFQKSQNALAKLQLIHETLNDGVVLNWNDRNQPKYYAWFERLAGVRWVFYCVNSHCSSSSLPVGSYLVNADLVRYSVNNFMDIWLDYLP